MKLVALKDIAPPRASSLPFRSDDMVWQLNLDQVESESGRILKKVTGLYSKSGTSTQAFDTENVLYSKLRPYLNKVVCPDDSGVATTELVPLRPDPTRLDRRYLTHYLRSPQFVRWVSNEVAGAKMPRVSMKVFWAHQIPLPPLEEQKRIAAILDAANYLRTNRRESISQIDSLLQSTFLEMFGDPVTNPKGWEKVRLESCFSKIRSGTCCGPFGSALKKHEYVNSGIPVWGIDNISPNQFVENGSLFITPEKYSELVRYSVDPGDILISRAGTVGRMCIAHPSSKESIIGSNLIRLTLSESEMIPVYFTSLYTYFAKRLPGLRAAGDEGAYSFLNTTKLKTLVIPRPPIEIQREFSDFLSLTRGHEGLLFQQLTELDTLFASLQSRAFRGEL